MSHFVLPQEAVQGLNQLQTRPPSLLQIKCYRTDLGGTSASAFRGVHNTAPRFSTKYYPKIFFGKYGQRCYSSFCIFPLLSLLPGKWETYSAFSSHPHSLAVCCDFDTTHLWAEWWPLTPLSESCRCSQRHKRFRLREYARAAWPLTYREKDFSRHL